MTSVDWPERIGRYRILSELGRGSMGRVFLALDPTLDRRIALKIIAPLQLVDADEKTGLERRFLHEARAAARLHHPGIVMVLDADTDPATGSPYLAMELVEGRSLKTVLRESGRLPVASAVDLGAQVARALDHAHRAGVVHRDVKPANILITPEGRIKVTDFGIAKLASQSMTLTGHILGSPFYMSPEQVEGEAVDGRADLFSLGSVLYQSVTGELAFGGDTLVTVTHKVVRGDPRPLRSHDRDLPASLETVIGRALEKDPERRFQTGAAMATALESVGRELHLPAGAVPESGENGEASASELVSVQDSPAAEKAPGNEAPGGRAWAAFRAGEKSAPPVRAPRRLLMLASLGSVVLALLVLFAFRPWEAPARPSAPIVKVGEPEAEQGTDGAATPPPDAVEVPETLQPPPVPNAELGLVYVQRLTRAQVSLWVDGELAWSRQVGRPGGLFKRLTGRRIEDSVAVTSGSHTIEVRVTGPSGDTEKRDVIEGSFRDGEVRRLRVGVHPITKNLNLSWIE